MSRMARTVKSCLRLFSGSGKCYHLYRYCAYVLRWYMGWSRRLLPKASFSFLEDIITSVSEDIYRSTYFIIENWKSIPRLYFLATSQCSYWLRFVFLSNPLEPQRLPPPKLINVRYGNRRPPPIWSLPLHHKKLWSSKSWAILHDSA